MESDRPTMELAFTSTHTPTQQPEGTPPILFIHGHGSGKDTFAELLADPALSHRYNLYAVDLRGHGESLVAGPWSRETFAEDVYAFVQKHIHTHTDNSKIVVVGHSMGVRVAVEFVSRHPECVCALVCLDMDCAPRTANRIAPLTTSVAEQQTFPRRFASVSECVRALVACGFDEIRMQQAVSGGRIHTTKQGPGDVWCGVHPWTYTVTASGDGPLLPDLSAQWQTVAAHTHIPTWLLLAENGSAATAAGVEWMQQTMPRLKVYTLQGSHHSVHKSNRAETVQHIVAAAELAQAAGLNGAENAHAASH
eukprot:GDKI01011748.1.p1 GENE.GDKI01011748.1~~GDKI01011748.1.p1  ORF type:complete len:308 (-),score=91.83 GDKI01011748.1:107-1030(-)